VARQIHPLTSLRFFAALGIFIFHWQALGVQIAPFAAQGVSFFFVLSGFILTHVHREVPSVRGFYRRRFARIWPIHFVTFLIVAFFLPSLSSPSAIPLNVLLLHAWVPLGAFVFSFNAVSWSVSDELFFYLLFPIFVRARRIYPYVVGAGALTLAIVVTANHSWFTPPASTAWQNWILQHPLSRLLEFLVGVACGRYFVRHPAAPRILAAAPTLTEVAVLGLVVLGLWGSTWSYGRLAQPGGGWLLGPGTAAWCSQIGAMPVFAFTILVFAYGRGGVSRVLSWPVLILLGEISYSTYMLHQIVLAFAVKYSFTQMLGLTPTLVVVVLVTYVGSYCAWRWIEIPARKLFAGVKSSAPRVA
jgi:peptidoglycan/LPS O-acetylase OafA/YrhL